MTQRYDVLPVLLSNLDLGGVALLLREGDQPGFPLLIELFIGTKRCCCLPIELRHVDRIYRALETLLMTEQAH